jgi:hypothetical protein
MLVDVFYLSTVDVEKYFVFVLCVFNVSCSYSFTDNIYFKVHRSQSSNEVASYISLRLGFYYILMYVDARFVVNSDNLNRCEERRKNWRRNKHRLNSEIQREFISLTWHTSQLTFLRFVMFSFFSSLTHWIFFFRWTAVADKGEKIVNIYIILFYLLSIVQSVESWKKCRKSQTHHHHHITHIL